MILDVRRRRSNFDALKSQLEWRYHRDISRTDRRYRVSHVEHLKEILKV
jgi:hypothetical protein